MDRELKTFKFEVKEVNEEEGTFTGYAATFSDQPDSYGDIIDRGAFKKTLKEGGNRIKILWNHYILEPIGKPIEMSEDDKGLLVKGKLSLGVQRAREVLSLMKDGVITELSIGYDSVKEKLVDGIRHLQEIRLWDFSPVTFAANPDAIITGVKRVPEPEAEKTGRVLSATNLEKIKKAFDALQALLDSIEKEDEPAKATLISKTEKEAAEMETIINSLQAGNGDLDTKEAEKRIQAILDKLKK